MDWKAIINKIKPGQSSQVAPISKSQGDSSSKKAPEMTRSERPRKKLSPLILLVVILISATLFGSGTYFYLSVNNSRNSLRREPPVSTITTPPAVVASGNPQEIPHNGGQDKAPFDIKNQNPFKADFLKKINQGQGDIAVPKIKLSQLPPPPMAQSTPPPLPKRVPMLYIYGIASINGKKIAFTSTGKLTEKDRIDDSEVLEILEHGIRFDSGFLPFSRSSNALIAGKRQ